MNQEDIDYYKRREAIERDLAAKATDPGIAQLHLDLAEGYASRVASGDRPTLKIAIGT